MTGLRLVTHGAAVLVLTVLTQLGGLAWAAALALRGARKGRGMAPFLLVFGLA